jgi:hypothetical protein
MILDDDTCRELGEMLAVVKKKFTRRVSLVEIFI